MTGMCSNIIALTQTWLHAPVTDAEVFDGAAQFRVYRYNCTMCRGGGILLVISSHIQSSVICMNETLEAIRATVTLTHKKFITGICYHSPSGPPTFFSSLHNNIKLVHTRFPSSASMITGDFNLPNIAYDYQSALLSPFLSQASDFSGP